MNGAWGRDAGDSSGGANSESAFAASAEKWAWGSEPRAADPSGPNSPGLAGWTEARREIAELRAELRDLGQRVQLMAAQIGEALHADRYRSLDLLRAIRRAAPYRWIDGLRLEAARSVAEESLDHRFPRGAVRDNTRSLRFVARVEEALAQRKAERGFLRALDLGCAGGGLVHDFLQRGHFAVGLEGSDAPKRLQLGEWPSIPEHLMTCDVSEPFRLLDGQGRTVEFDVVTAWDVLEHVPDRSLDALFANVVRHLAPGGLFLASVATFDDVDPSSGVNWHVTVRAEWWWRERLRAAGMVDASVGPSGPLFFDSDFPRGPGNLGDVKFQANPADGFYVVVRKA